MLRQASVGFDDFVVIDWQDVEMSGQAGWVDDKFSLAGNGEL